MGLLPITEKGKPVTCQADWPLFYMNDFSRLGLVVKQLGEAVAVLQASGFTVHEDERGVLLDVSGSAQHEVRIHFTLALARRSFSSLSISCCICSHCNCSFSNSRGGLAAV